MSRGSSGTGHYTQLVWAETDRIGCGSVYYRVTLFYLFVFLLKLAVIVLVTLENEIWKTKINDPPHFLVLKRKWDS